ncbi:YjcQ protein [Ligilactobacillus sp. WC1T17]|uniref:YjcQ protein n=2 Tax=Ligilactobacillus TaxID=2767887 RepID=A0ABY1A9R5_9LACO|nr:YjcQ protein [Ligilactobacillus ruminis]
MLTDDGYIKGLTVNQTKSGTVVGGINQLAVTSSGLQYLAENSMMKKAYKIFKEFRDWTPII